MLATLAEYAPTFGLLFFFCIFLGIAFWVMLPSKKKELQELAQIPLMEENHG